MPTDDQLLGDLPIDGRRVNYRGKTSWVGIVQGMASTPGHWRVDWESPCRQTGVHKRTDLVVVDAPPSQEELAKLLG
jgi:hypothetical protein